jgi:hypothetical protein
MQIDQKALQIGYVDAFVELNGVRIDIRTNMTDPTVKIMGPANGLKYIQ